MDVMVSIVPDTKCSVGICKLTKRQPTAQLEYWVIRAVWGKPWHCVSSKGGALTQPRECGRLPGGVVFLMRAERMGISPVKRKSDPGT